MDATRKKQNGIHYTPPKLARFLARQTAACIVDVSKSQTPPRKSFSILDPACGDGELLASFADALADVPHLKNTPIEIYGFDIDADAIEHTKNRIAKLDSNRIVRVDLRIEDFLCTDLDQRFNCVIANPPYVRTQVLGGKESQQLAKKFGLTGRVDLYQAFAMAISEVLCENGAMGLLTSNRFLTVKSGESMRRLIQECFDLKAIFDLGDTRLFEAAVLPVVIAAVKRNKQNKSRSETPTPLESSFHRIYQIETCYDKAPTRELIPTIEDLKFSGEFRTNTDCFRIERGTLGVNATGGVWTLSNHDTREWLHHISEHQATTFGEIAQIKVGIKTTADTVFIRENWEDEETKTRPEKKLRLPLITHHDAARWKIESPKKSVLYPYQLKLAKRTPVDISKFPRAAKYLETHRERLEGRRYVIESGREWYEIWVPHQPSDWKKPKIVWPDIAESPKFFLDTSGAVVNGDCYWIKLREGVDEDWLFVMLAVANSRLATKFYDTVFHNKLYAGRRRFMTQYVKEFPLPNLDSPAAKKIVKLVKRLVSKPSPKVSEKVESLVWESFGFDGPN
ncbi:MAG: N-6 DNA methylase [Mariniblastus sp.]